MDEIVIGKFNRIINQVRPHTFSGLMVLQRKSISKTDLDILKDLDVFIVDGRQSRYQLFVSKTPIKSIPQNIPFIEIPPKVNIYQTLHQTIIVQERVDDYLSQYMEFKQNQTSQHFSQFQTQKILIDLNNSLKQYIANDIYYNVINTDNIVSYMGSWSFSLPCLLFKTGNSNEDYYCEKIPQNNRYAYSLGCILFKMIFGFLPFEKIKVIPAQFSINDYLNHLQRQKNNQQLKTYSFLQRLLSISTIVKDLIEHSLSGLMSFQNWCTHPFFVQNPRIITRPSRQNLQIKMIEQAGKKHYSLALASIQYKKKFPSEKLNKKTDFKQLKTYRQVMQSYSQLELFKGMTFQPDAQQQKQRSLREIQSMKQIPLHLGMQYFWQNQFDPQQDKPCLQILRIIDQQKQKSGQSERYYQGSQRVYDIYKYAYPYALVFQLAKIQKKQLYQIKKKINRLSGLLLQVSSLNKPSIFPLDKKLHETKLVFKNFQQIKDQYRSLINQLYQLFMKEAIRKYNVKGEHLSMQEKKKSKEEGLQYYRLCLKLLEASVLNRKKGKELDLQRIQTSQRKQIQNDINNLLKEYFPNKAS